MSGWIIYGGLIVGFFIGYNDHRIREIFENRKCIKNYLLDKLKTKFQKPVNLEGDCFHLTYTEGPQEFEIVFKKNRHPFPYEKIMCGENDVTNDLRKFMVISKNFHGIPTTPKMLGFTQPLEFQKTNGETQIFQPDEIINK